MKKLLLTATLAAQTVLGLAQTNAALPGAKTNAAPARFSTGKQDTMRALGNMYVRHDRRSKAGKIWLGVALVGGLTTLRLTTPNNASPVPTTRYSDAEVALVGGVVAGVPLLIGVIKLAGSATKDRDSVVARYARRQPLPAGVVRQLRRKDFD